MPTGCARFEREAKALAALNHPNIAQVYGFEGRALAMELLEGETLRDRLKDGALSPRKAIDYGAQIARGLAAAHDRGIIHRDLKPENLFVLTDGRVKILDFGLARQTEKTPSGGTETMTSFGGTDPGTIMGTVGYMAPEQVRGAALDARTDLFALGAVLYEMLTGRRAFQRDTAAESMTAILKEDVPELTASRADLSPALDRIVRHCLEKNPIERFQTARDVAFALDSLSGSGSGSTVAASAPAPKTARSERWIWAGVTAALVGALGWQVIDRGTPDEGPTSPPIRLTLMLPEGIRLNDVIATPARLALSPDGQRLAFIGVDSANRRALWLQSLSDPAARRIDETEMAAGPTWSPDGKALVFGVFSASGSALKRWSLDGGHPTTIGDRTGWTAWSPDGQTLLLEPVRGEPVLLRMDGIGSPMTPVIPKVVNTGAFGHVSFLPDSRRFFHRFMAPGQPRTVATYVGSLDSPDRQLVISGNDISQVLLAHGALVFARNGTLLAQRFDAAQIKLTGEPVVIAEGVEQTAVGAAFTVSSTGTLAYQPKTATFGSRLAWIDRKGAPLTTLADAADYSNLELSPDGRRMLVSVRDAGANTRDIYIIDTLRGVRQRLTFDQSDERSAVWTADGRNVIYTSKGLDLYQRSAGFTGGETAVQTNHVSKDPNDVSSDGRHLLYRETGGSTSNDVWTMPLDGSAEPRKLIGTAFNENSARFSPDGRSIVFVSDDSGQPEVYVMSLEADGGKVQVSIGGGASPRWRRDGQEILYVNTERTMMSVPVKGSGARFETGSPSPLFEVDFIPSAGAVFDVTPDGQRFIVNTAMPSKVPPHVVVIVNWPALLK